MLSIEDVQKLYTEQYGKINQKRQRFYPDVYIDPVPYTLILHDDNRFLKHNFRFTTENEWFSIVHENKKYNGYGLRHPKKNSHVIMIREHFEEYSCPIMFQQICLLPEKVKQHLHKNEIFIMMQQSEIAEWIINRHIETYTAGTDDIGVDFSYLISYIDVQEIKMKFPHAHITRVIPYQ